MSSNDQDGGKATPLAGPYPCGRGRDSCRVLKVDNLLPGEVVQQADLGRGAGRQGGAALSAASVTGGRVLFRGAQTYGLVVAANGQELRGGGPLHRFDAQGVFVGGVGTTQAARQGVDDDFIMQTRIPDGHVAPIGRKAHAGCIGGIQLNVLRWCAGKRRGVRSLGCRGTRPRVAPTSP